MSGTTDLSRYKGKALVFTSQEEQIENEVYTTLNTEIEIKKDMFHKIWPGYYPRKELTNQIGSGMGIEHIGKSIIVEVFGDLEKYPDGREVRKIEGYRCHKSGRRRRPDGTWQQVDEMYEFNWIGRAKEMFLDDEEQPNNKRKYTFPDNPQKQRRAREKCIESLKKFASQRASTGADLCIIRALTGMSTSFKEDDIRIGKIIVSQIVESKLFQAKKAQAAIDNLRIGGNVAANIDDASNLLIGKPSSSAENTNKIAPAKKEEPEPEPVKEDEELTVKQQFDSLINDPKLAAIDGALEFYTSTVADNGGGDDVMTWAIGEIISRIDK